MYANHSHLINRCDFFFFHRILNVSESSWCGLELGITHTLRIYYDVRYHLKKLILLTRETLNEKILLRNTVPDMYRATKTDFPENDYFEWKKKQKSTSAHCPLRPTRSNCVRNGALPPVYTISTLNSSQQKPINNYIVCIVNTEE